MLLLTLLVTAVEVVPMNVSLRDPVLPIEVRDSVGGTYALGDITEEGLIYFLAPDCGACQEAIAILAREEAGRVPRFFLFVNQIPEGFSDTYPDLAATAFVVSAKDLEPYRITTFPAVLIYHAGRLLYAYHGPMPPGRIGSFGARLKHASRHADE